MGTHVVLQIILWWLIIQALAQPASSLNETLMTLPGCPYRCDNSNITIPYPFGIGSECAHNDSFVITCNHSITPPRPFIRRFGVEVLRISLDTNTVLVDNPPIGAAAYGNLSGGDSSEFSETYNYTAVLYWRIRGTCDLNEQYLCGVHTSCSPFTDWGWGISTEFTCSCDAGYEGNPYVYGGCQDIDECANPIYANYCELGCQNLPGTYRCRDNRLKKMALIGTGTCVGALFLLLSAWWTYKEMKRRKKIKLKQKFFKRNGGLLLQQQLSSGEEGNVEKTKMFTSKELENATDHYNENRILGKGGQGTVYKGMLVDGKIVAIKMSKMVDKGKLEEFINEVVILSQINHRNVVKLHGCCLETEVPLLVYEYIPNGTLFQYIHDQNEDFPLSWDVRLRIAAEVAAALSYLHSSTSKPIYHRDIKSTNILLDEKYRAKVADFGTSRSVAIDQTHLTTRVLGTFGYLDPEYFQSSQFTEKSDVYSFGVVLVELLTSQKPISSTTTDDVRSLATRFILAMDEDRLFDTLDARVMKEGGKEEIMGVANLAKRCLNLNGRKRPTMKEVAMELDVIRMSSIAPTVQQQYEKVEYSMDELTSPWKTTSTSTSTSTGSYMESKASLAIDIQPLL